MAAIKPTTVKLPAPLSRAIKQEQRRLKCHAGDIHRAALTRLLQHPLTKAEVDDAKLDIGKGRLGKTAVTPKKNKG